MSLPKRLADTNLARFPRSRGDEPQAACNIPGCDMFSPLTRG